MMTPITTTGMTTPIAISLPVVMPPWFGPGGVDEFGDTVAENVLVKVWDKRELGNALTPSVGKGALVLKAFPGKDVGQLGAAGVVEYRESGVPEGLSVAHWLCNTV